MSNLVEVKIPTNANPFTVTVNGKPYSYPAGATVEVPYEVAEVINQISRGPNLPPSSGGGSSGGGGADLLNENGVIKQKHLPENFPYKAKAMVSGDTLTWDGNTEGKVCVIDAYYKVSDATPSLEELEFAVITSTDESFEGGFSEAAPNLLMHNYGLVLIALADGVEMEGSIFPEKGIYLYAVSDPYSAYVESLTIPGYTGFVAESETVTKIGKEYLPDGYPYSEVSEGFVLPETSFAADEEGTIDLIGIPPILTIGQNYTVNWNDTEYTCVALDGSDMGEEGGYVLGNIGAMTGGDDTGEPFVIAFLPAEHEAVQAGIAGGIIPLDGTTEGTVSIFGMTEVVTPIAQKFLPDIDKGIEIVELYGSLSNDGTGHELSHARADIERAVDAGKIVMLKHAFNKSSSSVRFLHLSSMGSGSIAFTRQETAGQAVRFEEILFGTGDTIEYRKGMINAEVTSGGLITDVTMSAAEVTT